MKIETKFDIGQEVCFVFKGKITFDVIITIRTRVRHKMDGYEDLLIVYELEDGCKYFDYEFHECELFTTKQELLESL